MIPLESNLLLEYSAIVSNKKCVDVYRNVFNHLESNVGVEVFETATLYELQIIRTIEPNYILVKYVKS